LAENLRDIERLNAVFANSYAAFDSRRGLQRLCYSALSQAERFTKNKDKDAENENMAFFRSRAPFSIKLKYYLRRMLRALH
jgi:hypothetical protein